MRGVGTMPATFTVDQAETFSGMAALSCEPKTAFGKDEQEVTRDGVPKWTLQVVAGFTDQFGKVRNEVLNVGLIAKTNPLDGVGQFTPVRLKGFQVGVMDKTDRDGKVLGAQVWYRAEAVEAAIQPVSNGNGAGQKAKEPQPA
ncbi:MAG: hypothetical protein ACRDQA_31755 [Nocardioidaceae bacterium]